MLSASKEHMRVLKGTMWLLKSVRESALWPQACSHLYVALNEHALTSQVAAQSAERGGVWSLCIHNEWKERKTTQWHGQIRLSETIFKIWVRVQILTSPSHTPQRFTLPILQTIPPSSCPSTVWLFLSSIYLYLFTHLFYSLCPLVSCLSLQMLGLVCVAGGIVRDSSFACVEFHRQQSKIRLDYISLIEN